MAAHAIAMPRLGMTMEEGTVVEWPCEVGSAMTRGDVVLVIETEKAESEIQATVSGTLRHVFAPPGTLAPCGALLAAITTTPDEPFDATAFAAAYVPPDGPAAAPPPPAVAPAARARASGERKAVAPAARALARELGVDLVQVVGTGPNRRVTRDDVRAHASRCERLVEVEPGVGLEVLREGAGDPVALLPGFGSDLASFAPQLPQLAQRYRVIGIHARGVGGSDAPIAEAYAVDRSADDVAAVLSEPTHVVGASLGAATAIELALRHPQLVRTLTLLTPFVRASPRLLAVTHAWCRIAAEASAEALAAFLVPWLFGDALLGDNAARERTLRGLAKSLPRVPAATLARAAAGMRAWSGSRADDLGAIGVPTLVLAAGADLLTPDAASIAAAIPGARCEVLPGCGHALAIDGAERVTQALLDHWKSQ